MDSRAQAQILPVVVHLRRQAGIVLGAFIDPEYVFQYAEAGACDFRVEDKAYRIQGGDAILMSPHLPHALLPVDQQPTRYIVIHFTFPGQAPGYPLVVSFPKDDRRRISSRFDIMLEEWHDHKPGRELIVAGLMCEILGLHIRNGHSAPEPRLATSKSWRNVETAIRFIHDKYASPLRLSEISRAAGLSPTYLCMAFKEYTGRSPHQYLNQVRIEKAKGLLCDSDLNCSEVAALTGFSSIHAFSKVFRRVTRLSPVSWAREYLSSLRGRAGACVR
jgi:AraC-like DNA-binding protein